MLCLELSCPRWETYTFCVNGHDDNGERHGDDHGGRWRVEGLFLEDPDDQGVCDNDTQGFADILEECFEDCNDVQRGVALSGEGGADRANAIPTHPVRGPFRIS